MYYILAVIFHTLGRMFGTGCFNVTYYYVFPPTHFGLVSGLLTLTSIPIQFINVPMFSFIQNNDYDFQTMNFVMAGLCSLVFLFPVVIWSRDLEKRNEYLKSCNEHRKSDISSNSNNSEENQNIEL